MLGGRPWNDRSTRPVLAAFAELPSFLHLQQKYCILMDSTALVVLGLEKKERPMHLPRSR